MSISKNNNLFVSFYSDDLRFFYFLSKNIPNNSFFYSVFLSGVLYLLLKFKFSLNFFKKYDKNILLPLSFDDIICYEENQNKYNNEELCKNSINYIYFFNYVIKNNQIKYVYLSGDTRLIIKCAEYAAIQNKCKIIYFEQGPFGTTILDHDGVNKNCSFRNSVFNEDNSEISINNKDKISWNKYFRVFDYLLYNIFNYKQSHVYNDVASVFSSSRFLEKNKLSENYLLLVLQVPNDANMILNSPNFSNHLDIVKWTFANLPKNTQLLVREHPNFINLYEKKLYQFVEKNERIIFDYNSLNYSIKFASVVIVNNSTVGIEALLQNKKLVVLGDCYYDKIETVFKLKNINDNDILNRAIKSIVNKKVNISFINHLLKNELIGFHFRDKKYNMNNKVLVKKITNLYK
jgi:capsular polysaccharide export protein